MAIDSAETRIPEDDRVFFTDPGSQRSPNSVVRALYPGNAFLDLNATSSPIQTWMLPPFPAAVARPGGLVPQPNQPYIDREGTLFFIDRQSGVGRLDPDSDPLPLNLQTPGRTIAAPLRSAFTDSILATHHAEPPAPIRSGGREPDGPIVRHGVSGSGDDQAERLRHGGRARPVSGEGERADRRATGSTHGTLPGHAHRRQHVVRVADPE